MRLLPLCILEYNTFQDAVEKARIGGLPSEQEFVIQIEKSSGMEGFLGI
jgi:hypothetical protein